MGWGAFKPLLTEALVEALRPIQQRYGHWREDQALLSHVLDEGALRAAAVADATLKRVREAMGFLPPSTQGP
jgi:tryptophanyl-tRNA synthetase